MQSLLRGTAIEGSGVFNIINHIRYDGPIIQIGFEASLGVRKLFCKVQNHLFLCFEFHIDSIPKTIIKWSKIVPPDSYGKRPLFCTINARQVQYFH